MKVSIIIPCKGRLEQLKQCLPTVLAQTYENVEIVVVDYNCPENTAGYCDSIGVNYVKANVSADYWNLCKARNLGARNSTGEILLFLDADTILMPQFIESELAKLELGSFLTGLVEPPWNGCGCLFVYRNDFEAVRGYNELFEGWGYDDFNMYERLSHSDLTHYKFSPNLIENLSHEDSGRNEFHGNEDKYASKDRNFKIHLSGKFTSSINMTRTDIINHLIKKNGYKSYLEIGVRNANDNFNLIECDLKTGVDPDPYAKATHTMTSDLFFAANQWDYDIIFIDGLHHADQVFKDIFNSIHILNKGGTIVCHDMNPPTEANQIIPFEAAGEMNWTGDCWKAWVELRQLGGYSMKVLNTDWGVGVIQVDESVKALKISEEITYANLDANRVKWLNLVNPEFEYL
jgi:glycosyltransferase involved in cell wall biosynthesis